MANEIMQAQPAQEMTEAGGGDIGCGIFSNAQLFNTATRMATALSSSTIVPREYQNNVGNCLIAIEMAARIKTSPMMVMQNLYIISGRPSWSSQYIMAMINTSRRYRTELQFEMTGSGDSLECYAWAEDYNGHRVIGPTISMKMAKAEGWISKNGSKWQTMPEVMIRYRAASFFGRMNCPDMVMGLYSADEAREMRDLGERDTEPLPAKINKSQVQELMQLTADTGRQGGITLELHSMGFARFADVTVDMFDEVRGMIASFSESGQEARDE